METTSEGNMKKSKEQKIARDELQQFSPFCFPGVGREICEARTQTTLAILSFVKITGAFPHWVSPERAQPLCPVPDGGLRASTSSAPVFLPRTGWQPSLNLALSVREQLFVT